MQVQTTARPAEAGVCAGSWQVSARVLRGMGVGELTAALCASDMPTAGTGAEPPAAQLVAWAVQGRGRLGERAAWWIDYRSRDLGMAASRARSSNARAEAVRLWEQRGRLWPSVARQDRAGSLAHALIDALRTVGLWVQPSMVYVPVEWPDGSTVETPMPTRDVEMIVRHGRPPADLAWPL